MDELTIFALIVEERKRQDAEFGGPEHDRTNDAADWCHYINKQTNSAVMVTDVDTPDARAVYRNSLVKAAALCIAALEHCPFAQFEANDGGGEAVTLTEEGRRALADEQ